MDSGFNGRGTGSDWVETSVGWMVQLRRATQRCTRSWMPNDVPTDQVVWSTYLLLAITKFGQFQSRNVAR
jgi:hypothetical protein